MRIAVVSPHLPTPALPMRGRTASAELAAFAAAGHDVAAVVPLAWSRRRLPASERDGEVVVAHPRYPRPPRLLGDAGALLERELFARAAAGALPAGLDVVLLHSATLPGGLRGRVGRARLVVTLHDHELQERAPRSRLVRAAIARTLRGADAAVYVSEALRAVGLSLAGPHRSLVIPIGIDVAPELASAPPATFTICTVARLVARKRVDRLLRAFARLAREVPGARLVIVGDGPERAALGALARALGIGGSVEMTGALDAEAAQRRIASASVMALPSVMESLGAVYLEAMALGVPALGTLGEGIAAHIEDGVSGLLVPPGDDEALFAALLGLARDPARARRIGEAGRRRFEAGGFGSAARAEAYLALFAELLAGR